MATVRDILTRAIRMTGARALGDTPEAEELTTGLTSLQTAVDSVVGLGGPMTDVYVTADYTAGENERITAADDSLSITVPATVVDAQTGQTRTPRNGAIVEICGGGPDLYVYCTSLAAWMKVRELTLDDPQPFGPQHDEGLAAMIAVRLGPDLQQAVPQWVVELAQQGRRNLNSRLRQPARVRTDPLLLSPFQRCGGTR